MRRREEEIEAIASYPYNFTGSGYPLPASGFKGEMRKSDSAPHIGTLPVPVVNDQRWVKDPEDVEYLGRYVIELNGPDTLALPVISDLQGQDWRFSVYPKDLNPSQASSSAIISMYDNLGNAIFTIRKDTSDRFYFRLFNAGSVLRTITNSLVVSSSNFSMIEITKIGADITLRVDFAGSTSTVASNTDGWDSQTVVTSTMSDFDVNIRPLQVCCIKQFVGNNLDSDPLDWFKCDEPVGETEIINYGSRSTPATLSDAAAHALALVAQPTKSQGVWMWDNVVELSGPDTLHFYVLPRDIAGAGYWCFAATIDDRSLGTSVTSRTIWFKNAAEATMLAVSQASTGKYLIGLYNGGSLVRSVVTNTSHIQQQMIRIYVYGDGSTISLKINNEIVTITDFTGWTTFTGLTYVRLTDDQAETRPLRVCDVTMCTVGNVLTDYVKCNTPGLTSLPNLIAPSRPAILSDVTAFTEAWKPLDIT